MQAWRGAHGIIQAHMQSRWIVRRDILDLFVRLGARRTIGQATEGRRILGRYPTDSHMDLIGREDQFGAWLVQEGVTIQANGSIVHQRDPDVKRIRPQNEIGKIDHITSTKEFYWVEPLSGGARKSPCPGAHLLGCGGFDHSKARVDHGVY